MRVALVQDWLTEFGGAEKVFAAIYSIFPEADIYTLVASPEVLNELGIDPSKVNTSFLQKMPGCPKHYRNYLPLFKYAIEQFDLSNYNLIISSSYCVAKGVLTNHNQIHISYCHSPVRYAWDLYHQYLKEAKLNSGTKGLVVKYFLHKLRNWDVNSSNRVDFFISNSNYISSRISKIYRRKATTIYPPVNISDFELCVQKDDFYITCSRLVPYKRIDLIISAFNKMPEKKLIVIGNGPEYKKLKNMAGSNIYLMGYQTFDVLREKMQKAKAFIYAAEEDFGIVPVEAQACGTPVIGFAKGGLEETVIHKQTGIHFYKQDESAIVEAVNEFESSNGNFNPELIRGNAMKFSEEIFKRKFLKFVEEKIHANINYHTSKFNSEVNEDLLVSNIDL
jgi:glycosyltransferase involved in cell wall biosynthesis